MTIHRTAAAGSTRPSPTAPATVLPLPPHPGPTRRLAATRIRSTDAVAGGGRSELAEAATSLGQACRAMPAAAVTAVLLLAEGLLLIPLWAALRCALAAWHRLHRPTAPT